MQIVVLANERLRSELLAGGGTENAAIKFTESLEDFLQEDADVYLDLLFDEHAERKQDLLALLPSTVIINSVVHTLQETVDSFIRINAWPFFLRAASIEAAANDNNREVAENVFALFHKKIEWLPDEPGFVAARVVSMIINEAYLALGEGVSTKEEINTAMKLGTNYPAGPFEWAERTGIQKIQQLLLKLSEQNARYTPAAALMQEVAAVV